MKRVFRRLRISGTLATSRLPANKMSAVTYQNTLTNIPNWVSPIHADHQRGYAYECDGRFFHVYGRGKNLWILSTGLTVSEPSINRTLDGWFGRVFGATNCEPMSMEPGQVVSGVWRPGLYFKTQIHQALETNDYLQRTAEQALRILIEKLDEILLYIEPTAVGLQSYGHKSRELLILACTEVENLWAQYMRLAGVAPSGRMFNTNDYVKLLKPLHLADFAIFFKLFHDSYSVTPFGQWNVANPTHSLPWYSAYNKAKHDREQHFQEATLENCLHAISAVVAMFCARHSPYPLVEGNSSLAALFTQHFDIELREPDPRSFYVPAFNVPANIRTELFCAGMTEHMRVWERKPLTI